MATTQSQLTRFFEQSLAAIDMGGLEHARGQFALVEGLADKVQTARAIAQVQVADAGLAGHETRHMGIGRHAQQLVQGGLTRAVIADRQLADSQDAIDVDDVSAHAAGQGGRRQVVAAGVAKRGHAFGHQAAGRGD